MKYLSYRLFCITICCLSLLSMAFYLTPPTFTNANPHPMILSPGDDYAADWKEVEKMEQKGKTESAQKLVQKIYDKAINAGNDPQIIKSILHLYKYDNVLVENSELKIVKDLKERITEVDQPTKSVLNSILGEFYWQYFQSNRYSILQRTAGAGDENDFTTWDVSRLSLEAKKHYLASIESKVLLQNTTIDGYKSIVNQQKGSEKFRPTLYDLLAHRAIDFLSNDQANISKANDQFELSDLRAFTDAKQFPGLLFVNTDEQSLKHDALVIYQELTQFHLHRSQNKPNYPLMDLELKRLAFVKQIHTAPNKNQLYIDALTKLGTTYNSTPYYAYIQSKLAESYNDEVEDQGSVENNADPKNQGYKKALTICKEAIEKYPKGEWTSNCRNIVQNITWKRLHFDTEKAFPPNQAIKTKVSFKNVDKIYGRSYRVTPAIEKMLNSRRYDQADMLSSLQNKTPEQEWQEDLVKADDYRTHSAWVAVPPHELGHYILVISNEANFDHIQTYTDIYVTNLSTIEDRAIAKREIHWHILDRTTGQALPAIDVEVYTSKYDYSSRKNIEQKVSEGKSDESGSYTYPGSHNRYNSLIVKLYQGEDYYEFASNDGINKPHYADSKQLYFFLDRSIYRPGQTVYFKGIFLQQNAKHNDHQLLKNKQVTLEFLDVNWQKIKEETYTTNEFGSLQGTFDIPSNLLNGRMHIRTKNHGSTSFQVEEYKRPKFEVVFDPVTGSYKLNDEVSVTGQAKAFAGFQLDNAQVRYRVTRRAHFPYWGWWSYYRQPHSPERVITNGTTTTDKNGKFTIQFDAIPDVTIDSKQKPQFNYEISVDITDVNGETQSNETTVPVGYQALLASITVPQKVDKQSVLQFPLSTTNLSGEFEAANVEVTVHRLQDPDRILRKNDGENPDTVVMTQSEFVQQFPYDIYKKEDNPITWKKIDQIFTEKIKTTKDQKIDLSVLKNQPTGTYLVTLTTSDKYGEKIEWQQPITLFSYTEKTVPSNQLFWYEFSKKSAEPGESVDLLLGSAAENTRFFIQVLHRNKVIQEEWLTLHKEQGIFNIPIKEKHRGNIAVEVSMIRFNQYHHILETITVPFSNKELDISVKTYRDKLQPGKKEEWQLTIKGADKEWAAAELLTGMYDASLDEFLPHNWHFNPYSSHYYHHLQSSATFEKVNSRSISNKKPQSFNYRYPDYDRLNLFGANLSGYGRRYMMRGGAVAMEAAPMVAGAAPPPPTPAPVMMDEADGIAYSKTASTNMADSAVAPPPVPEETTDEAATDKKSKTVPIRKNLQEMAFFMPQLKTNDKGEIIFSFEAPEALTKWKWMGLAHTQDLEIGSFTKEVVTQKELMVIPNPPRFFRENDAMTFSGKVTNLSDKTLSGVATLELFDALTMDPVSEDFGIPAQTQKSFEIGKGESTSVDWDLEIPEGKSAILYRIIAQANEFSDGEENALPVLTNRTLVTESFPLAIRGKEKKDFIFENLKKANKSTTLKHHQLSLEFTSQPAWYAVQALPYLMEYPYECSEQIFSRYYANSIASYVANSDPRIKKVFETWTNEATAALKSGNVNNDALSSNLQKNEDLKSVLLQETPWVMEAKNEAERKRRLGVLLDIDRMRSELIAARRQLQERQSNSGGWAWFPGGRENRYITQHILAGFGHLEVLEVVDAQKGEERRMIQQAMSFVDEAMHRQYVTDKKNKELSPNHISPTTIHYLYTRSFFHQEFPLNKQYEEAYNYHKEKATRLWLDQSKYLQAMTALALHRLDKGDNNLPEEILTSLKENMVKSEELGYYFKEQHGWFWYQAPIERHALLIEAFHEITDDQATIDELKIWMLKQKQTQDWKTTKATADAVYALLIQGTDWLSSDELVQITVGGQALNPASMPNVYVEAGTGHFRTDWEPTQITEEMGKITVEKNDEGIAWGAMYWQYFEQLDKITPAETPLAIEKQLYKEVDTKSGAKLEALSDGAKLKVGDKVKVRITIRVDRDMEYVHLKDMRAAAFEPMNVISRYKYQDGLGYYETTKDAATNFFMDWLPKGTYVFEYPLRASQRGNFSNGITSMQCMYAPEFSSHSEGVRVTVE